MAPWVYNFGDGTADGSAELSTLLGGKGAGLAEMARLGLPVPPGFTITTEVCAHFYRTAKAYPEGLRAEVDAALDRIAKVTGRRFGDSLRPQLLSVRSGARASMPGMMDTVLNLGLNPAAVAALAEETGDARFAWDTWRRFVQMYGSVVLGLPHDDFEEALDRLKGERDLALDTDLSADDWRDAAGAFTALVAEKTGAPFPTEPREQLWGAIDAVFGSWMNPRAITYRALHGLPADWGTAVTVQAMVFGNSGEDSATGVAFTRDPSTGERTLYGEFLVNAQGEDVVAGLRTPQYLTEAGRRAAGSDRPSLETVMPAAFAEFRGIADQLERHFRDMQDLEFTIEHGRLNILQARSGKRTAEAALRIAVEMAGEGLITEAEAVGRIDADSIDQLLHPSIDPDAHRDVLAMGLPASPGAATGAIVLTPEAAAAAKAEGRRVILVRAETSPEDIHGMHAAEGILTTRGGMTSHAAVVARGMGKPCVSGAGALRVDQAAGTVTVGRRVLKTGDTLTIDGGTGEVIVGSVTTRRPAPSPAFATLMGWADRQRRLKVRANADTPHDARTAREFGAEGIGLCRTEHMFFDEGRIQPMREMILATDTGARRAALDKLLPMQRADFAGIFEAMAGFPVTIRLLDPPLHEFLPDLGDAAGIDALARALGTSAEKVRSRVAGVRESNPMLGHRGCRLLVTYPEIADMQARAIFLAALDAQAKTGAAVAPEIMVPLVALKSELDFVKARIDAVATEVAAERAAADGGAAWGVPYSVGTMIELPRAALRAGELAEVAEFFSFGTNDLTQTGFGLSRDDSGGFLSAYVEGGLLKADPFATLDTEGIGELIGIAVARGRAARPDLKLGICGEHGGDPVSIRFFHAAGLDYVSCSPYRVPIARLAAAQAAGA